MKKAGTLLYLCSIIVMVLAGCSRTDAEPVHEVKLEQLGNGAKSFVEQIKEKNGLYLYSPAAEHQYLIVNYSSVIQGEEAQFLNSLQAEAEDQTLTINLEELGTPDSQDKRLEGMRIFELGNAQDYGSIQIHKNGKSAVFDCVGG
jgi:hypothetical protein